MLKRKKNSLYVCKVIASACGNIRKRKTDTYRKAVQNDTGWVIILKQRAPFQSKYSNERELT